MTGIVHIVMRLLLLSLIITAGVHGEDNLVFAERDYDITYPCEGLVCFHIWQFSVPNDYIAIVSNGEIKISEDENSQCTLKIEDLTAEDIGRHRCQQRLDVFSSHSTRSVPPVLNVIPGKALSFQCVFLTDVEWGNCYTPLQQQVILMWVDGNGTKIQEDSQHQIKQQSPCDITLTVTLQSPESKTFRCQATVDKGIHTSVELRVRVPALKGKGRGYIKDVDSRPKGGKKDVVGAAVGVVGCVVLTGVVALFVLNKTRTNNQLPDELSYPPSTNNVMNMDDVIYADIIFPVGSDRVCVHEYDSTEYACIRHI